MFLGWGMMEIFNNALWRKLVVRRYIIGHDVNSPSSISWPKTWFLFHWNINYNIVPAHFVCIWMISIIWCYKASCMPWARHNTKFITWYQVMKYTPFSRLGGFLVTLTLCWCSVCTICPYSIAPRTMTIKPLVQSERTSSVLESDLSLL